MQTVGCSDFGNVVLFPDFSPEAHCLMRFQVIKDPAPAEAVWSGPAVCVDRRTGHSRKKAARAPTKSCLLTPHADGPGWTFSSIRSLCL